MTKVAAVFTDLQRTLNYVLDLAKKQGASSAEAAASQGKGFSVTARLGAVETLSHHQDKSLAISVYFGQKTASVDTNDFSDAALQLAVNKACNIAKFTQEDPCAGLAEKKFLAFDYPQLDLYHPWSITPEKALEQAISCENTARAYDPRIQNSEGASVDTYESFFCYGNSEGFMGYYPASLHSLSCALIANDGHGMERDYDYTTARDAVDLMDISLLAKSAAERTIRRLSARKIPTQQCPVIFSSDMARGLIKSLLSAISGGNLYRHTSFLQDQLGQQIFPSFVNISENPHLLKGLGSAPFDGEGVKTNTKDLIHEGILKSYLLGSYSARKLKMQTTGNSGGAHNVLVDSTGHTLLDLLQQMQRGLLVTELMGQGVNIVTGDYSRGAFGFWVENGEIQFPVHEITIAGNLREMFAKIVAIGNDIDHRGNVQTGSILLENMTIAGH